VFCSALFLIVYVLLFVLSLLLSFVRIRIILYQRTVEAEDYAERCGAAIGLAAVVKGLGIGCLKQKGVVAGLEAAAASGQFTCVCIRVHLGRELAYEETESNKHGICHIYHLLFLASSECLYS